MLTSCTQNAYFTLHLLQVYFYIICIHNCTVCLNINWGWRGLPFALKLRNHHKKVMRSIKENRKTDRTKLIFHKYYITKNRNFVVSLFFKSFSRILLFLHKHFNLHTAVYGSWSSLFVKKGFEPLRSKGRGGGGTQTFLCLP